MIRKTCFPHSLLVERQRCAGLRDLLLVSAAFLTTKCTKGDNINLVSRVFHTLSSSCGWPWNCCLAVLCFWNVCSENIVFHVIHLLVEHPLSGFRILSPPLCLQYNNKCVELKKYLHLPSSGGLGTRCISRPPITEIGRVHLAYLGLQTSCAKAPRPSKLSGNPQYAVMLFYLHFLFSQFHHDIPLAWRM